MSFLLQVFFIRAFRGIIIIIIMLGNMFVVKLLRIEKINPQFQGVLTLIMYFLWFVQQQEMYIHGVLVSNLLHRFLVLVWRI